jgi:predicted nucleotide-binding protein (sugar kinase/HSP70/actin superfamily)
MCSNLLGLNKRNLGIPKGISYYNNFPFYYGFFNKLGFNIVLSDNTTSKLINDGAKLVVSDTCFPIKVFVGHVINLLDKGCDTIFVPSIQSTGYKINNCSKVRGLPEIIRNVINRPFTMIEPTLDKTEGLGLKEFCYDAANQLGITDVRLIDDSIAFGWEIYDNFMKMAKSGISYNEAIKNAIEGKIILKKFEVTKPLSVVIMAHGYNLYDERISVRLLKKLEKMGVRVYTSLNITKLESLQSIHELDEIQYWANELDLTGTAAYYMLNNKVDGIIALSAFGCGPDSLMVDEIEYHASQRKMPMLHLTIDEHTGEAGFITRLEAFIDMLIRKKRSEEHKIPKINKNGDVPNVAIQVEKERTLTKV